MAGPAKKWILVVALTETIVREKHPRSLAPMRFKSSFKRQELFKTAYQAKTDLVKKNSGHSNLQAILII